MKFTRYIIGLLLLVSFLTFFSCNDELQGEMAEGSVVETEDDGMVDVTISFKLADLGNVATRDGETDGESDINYDLTDMDLLIYSLRDSVDNVLKQYGKGIVDEELKEKDENGVYKTPALQGYNLEEDNNQTLMKVDWVNNTATNRYELVQEVKLRVMRGTVYKFSCWVQSSKTKAYDFNYLTAVKINYDEAVNNDELRDAFCSTSIFSIGQVESKIEITLTRPCAQINVGVDDEYEDNDGNYEKYSQSQITLNGVATYFNVVENKAWSEKDFTEHPRGKYNNYDRNIFVGEGREPIFEKNDVTFTFNNKPTGDNGTFTVRNYNDWSGDKPAIKTYKNLSMCYVFVPESEFEYDSSGDIADSGTAEKPDDNTDDDWNLDTGVVAPTLKNVKIGLKSFSMKEGENDGNPVFYPKDGADPIELEVKRNWRTNLLFKDWTWIEN